MSLIRTFLLGTENKFVQCTFAIQKITHSKLSSHTGMQLIWKKTKLAAANNLFQRQVLAKIGL